ncbi:MBL fold metallo-hydrolase RNA specificity domain-containing protein [Legionella israelensis]|uniref:Metallo-beta-lactamase n=1 Tax=Legionella israelensis TaxID=454 RepID=A0A0W0V1Y5_9GAMM|nr:MBL fold metallo-hydrolase [Legionella israelensis]KTD14117.1 metallo-beta-lactamase [Legionella israelensis]QBS10318.1 MBL fold metallo-hydrolase [Legionella israelensis]SCY34688.1 metallo-beta-lactamase family protein [Legionella israelensis DSM 19235]STX59919.1 metallo-beta-lactamase [Legionella israelensis]
MNIQFLGATQTVTGSKYLLKTTNETILIDCGLFQGFKELRLRNWNPLPINPADISTVLLTHAHIDHSGYIPLLVKNGFRGKIFCSEATLDLCEILLPDSGHLHEEEARFANKKKYSKHHPALALYTQEEAETSLQYFESIPFEKPFHLKDNLTAQFFYAGHILGASFIRVQHNQTSILFSGDLGRHQDPIMYPPQKPPQSDYYVIESTYGDRLHESTDPQEQLKHIINKTAKRGGVIVIPSFAVGRAQTLLYYIHQIRSNNEIPDIPVYIDSPMATDATKLFYHHSTEHRLSKKESQAICQSARYVHTPAESKALDDKKVPMIIISASGMATGGRVLHHIRRFAPDHRNSIVFAGFQASGTRGDRMIRREKEIKMFGLMVPIRAEIFQLENISAHIDSEEMLAWLSQIKKTPKTVFITHGDKNASQALKQKIEQRFKWQCQIPSYKEVHDLK